MTTWRKVQGDVNDTLVVTLSGVETLTGATAVAYVWRKNVDRVTLIANVTSPTNRTVSVELGDATGWLSDAAGGVWFLEIEVLFADGTILTWPTAGPDKVSVRADAPTPTP